MTYKIKYTGSYIDTLLILVGSWTVMLIPISIIILLNNVEIDAGNQFDR